MAQRESGLMPETKDSRDSRKNQRDQARRPEEKGFLKTIEDEASPEAWAELVGAAKTQVLQGDARAREWLGYFLMGRPRRMVRTSAGADDKSLFDAPKGIYEQLAKVNAAGLGSDED